MDRTIKIINKLIPIISILIGIPFLIKGITLKNISRIMTITVVPLLFLLPYILKKLKILKLNNSAILLYNIFIFFADVLGCVVGLYNKTSWYDVVMHFSSGVLTTILAYSIFNKLTNSDNKLLKITYLIGFSMMIAVIWEIFEFSFDNLFNMNLQHNKDTGVCDTMEDMICALVGTVIVLLTSILPKKKNIFLKFMDKVKLD